MNWWRRRRLDWNRNRLLNILNRLHLDWHLLDRLNWLHLDWHLLNWLNLLDLMLLHFKLCQLLLCVFNIILSLIDVLILSFKILYQLLMVNNTFSPIQNICGTHWWFSSWFSSISFNLLNLIFSIINSSLRKSLGSTELV